MRQLLMQFAPYLIQKLAVVFYLFVLLSMLYQKLWLVLVYKYHQDLVVNFFDVLLLLCLLLNHRML